MGRSRIQVPSPFVAGDFVLGKVKGKKMQACMNIPVLAVQKRQRDDHLFLSVVMIGQYGHGS